MSEWPQRGDSLRAASKDERFHSQLDLGDWGIYPKAYLDAAELLVGAIASGSNPDVIVYPLMYLYRHYVELTIKNLIGLGRALDSSPDPSGHPDHHTLCDLWSEARTLIAKYAYDTGEKQQDLEAVSSVIGEFARLDPKGEVFRFDVTPFDKKKRQRESTLPSTVPLSLSLDQVAKVMKRVSNFLDTCIDVMHELWQYEADVKYELSGYTDNAECSTS